LPPQPGYPPQQPGYPPQQAGYPSQQPGYPPQQPGGATPPPAGTLPPFAFDAKRWTQAERITGGATVVLFISLFLPWYTYSFGLGSVSTNGLWHGWMYLVLFICLAIILYLVARAGFEEMPVKLPLTESQRLLIATGVNAVLVILAFLTKPGGVGIDGIGWGFGAFVGLVAAIIAVAPLAVPALNARRNRP